jgi:hypothetical protein
VRARFGVASLVVACLLTIVTARSSASMDGPMPSATQQLLVVHAASWDSASGSLERYERETADESKRVGTAIAVNLGRNGLASGRGLHPIPANGPRKARESLRREFSRSPERFGLAPAA